MTKLCPNPLLSGSVAVLVLGSLVVIGGLAGPSMLVYNSDYEMLIDDLFQGKVTTAIGVGLFTWDYENIVEGVVAVTISKDGSTCDNSYVSPLKDPGGFYDKNKDKECFKSLASRCNTGQDFGLIGFFAQMGAVVALSFELFMGEADLQSMRVKIAIALVAVASFSYMIVFSVWASVINGDFSEDFSESGGLGCGFSNIPVTDIPNAVNTGDDDVFSLFAAGAAFDCWVIMWLATLAHAVVLGLQVLGITDINAMCGGGAG